MLTQLKKKPGPDATGKGHIVGVRIHDDVLRPLDDFASELSRLEDTTVARPEAIRRIVKEWLVKNAYASQSDFEERDHLTGQKPIRLTAEEDAAINAHYASGAPGMGAHFMRAMINHMRAEMRRNPDITVEEVKEYVLDIFDDYGQPLDTPPET